MKEFFASIKLEFKKITWPTDKEMKLHTTQVFVFMIVLSLFFAGVDEIIMTGMNAVFGPTVPVVEEGNYDDYDLDDLLDDYDLDGNGTE